MRLPTFIISSLLGVLVLAGVLQALVGVPAHQPPTAQDTCAGCHDDVVGIESAHAGLGCAACHLGQATAKTAEGAHRGLVRIPGNFADMAQTCGASGCHLDVPARLERNIMQTMNGVVSVDRWVFGEQPTPTAVTPVTKLGTSPADLHLRNLCASCHLGHEKRQPGPITERTRGGGCTACHLASAGDLDGGPRHATLRALPNELACFGCHARSGRISLSFEGWHELTPLDGGCGAPARRRLEDGRCVERRAADVHFEAGLRCVDCHGSWEVMGAGLVALHREDQSVVRCDDCHTRSPRTTADLDAESRRLVTARGLDAGTWLVHQKSGKPLVNAWAEDGGLWLEGKYSGRRAHLAPPARACTSNAHRSLACASCHSAWAPQCAQCHTRFEPDSYMYDLLEDREREGEWIETGGPALAEPPTLGVREGDAGREVIPFAPGMILTLQDRFQRLFAPTSPHTTRREPRSCDSCHRDPLALGYGRGRLDFAAGRWTFQPAFDAGPDGLPEDAWNGFLSPPRAGSSTREDTRSFSVAEQRRILTVATCLSCHPPDSAPMVAALNDFSAVLSRRTRACQAPHW